MLIAHRTALYLISGATLLVMLAAGLDPRGYPFCNDAYADDRADALSFRGHGIAYSEPFVWAPEAKAVSVVLALSTAADADSHGFQAVATISSGTPRSQLLIAQWKHQFIVMSGDDYAYRNRGPRLTAPVAGGSTAPVLLALVLNEGKAALYVDGQPVAFSETGISLPDDGLPLALILGNSADGTLPWHGRLFEVVLYSRALTATEAAESASEWQASPHSFRLPDEGIELRYDFAGPSGPRVEDQSEHARQLLIPRYRAFIDPSFPAWKAGSTSLWDLLLNLFGFIPFGYLLAACIARTGATLPVLGKLLIIGSSGVLFSGFIEFAQAWIPTRTASLLDVLLNGAGAVLGAGLWVWLGGTQDAQD